MKIMKGLGLIVAASLCFAETSFSQTQSVDSVSSELAKLRESVAALTELVKTQQQQISALEAKQTAPASQPVRAVPPAAAPVRSGTQYLPDIGVVADIVASSSQSDEDEEGNDRLSAREVEIVLGHDIDPYARLDATITFSDEEDPELEEAVVSYWGLPGDVKARIGRMRQKVGKATAMHPDSLDTVDEPLVVARYLGVEGLFRTGVELSTFSPLSSDAFTQELIVGFMEGGVGEEGELFGETRRAPSYYGRLVNFLNISDMTSFEFGGSYLLGSADTDSTPEVHGFGIDTTFNHHFNPTQKLKLQGEMYLQNRPRSGIDSDGEEIGYDNNPFGFYALADYRFAKRWGTGFRFDYVRPTALQEDGAESAERAYNGYITFYQSEFARWRFQYQRYQPLDGDDDNRFFLQGTFAIGTHKHQLS